MHNNYYFLRQLSRQLHESLKGFTIVSCFTQNKDELVLECNNAAKSIFLKASLEADFCCLSFPDKFSRARKNSLDLFPEIILHKILGVHQYENERAFSLLLESGLTLLFKMHGNRANIVLFKGNTAVSIFRNHLKADLEIQPDAIDRSIDWSREAFVANLDTLKETYFTFGKEIWSHLREKGFDQESTDHRWGLLQATLNDLEHPGYYIVLSNGKPVFTLFSSVGFLYHSSHPMEAVTHFYYEYLKTTGFTQSKSTSVKDLSSQIASGKAFLRKNQQKLDEFTGDVRFQQWADLIMANLDRIRPGMDKIVVPNFYDDERPVEISLRKEWNAQTNAEDYYRKAKHRQIEMQKLRESIQSKQDELARIEKQLHEVEQEQDAAGLGKVLQESTTREQNKEVRLSLPYHEFVFKGFRIWVGKDAKSNDTLTQKFAFKDDLWLHAKDVPGSHVLIKHQAGKPFPRDVIERAAELAAYHSKRKTDSLCPVTVTPKKMVRKRKGDPAGTVVVEREDVILVTPTK